MREQHGDNFLLHRGLQGLNIKFENMFGNSGLQKSPITSKIELYSLEKKEEVESEIQEFCF